MYNEIYSDDFIAVDTFLTKKGADLHVGNLSDIPSMTIGTLPGQRLLFPDMDQLAVVRIRPKYELTMEPQYTAEESEFHRDLRNYLKDAEALRNAIDALIQAHGELTDAGKDFVRSMFPQALRHELLAVMCRSEIRSRHVPNSFVLELPGTTLIQDDPKGSSPRILMRIQISTPMGFGLNAVLLWNHGISLSNLNVTYDYKAIKAFIELAWARNFGMFSMISAEVLLGNDKPLNLDQKESQ